MTHLIVRLQVNSLCHDRGAYVVHLLRCLGCTKMCQRQKGQCRGGHITQVSDAIREQKISRGTYNIWMYLCSAEIAACLAKWQHKSRPSKLDDITMYNLMIIEIDAWGYRYSLCECMRPPRAAFRSIRGVINDMALTHVIRHEAHRCRLPGTYSRPLNVELNKEWW